MSVLDTLTPRGDQARQMPQRVASDDEAISTGPVGYIDAMLANVRLSLDDREDVSIGNKIKAYQDVEDALVGMGYPRSKYRKAFGTSYFGPDYTAWQDSVWSDVQDARRKNPRAFAELPQSREETDKWAAARRGARAQDKAISAQGGFGSSIIPTLAMGIWQSGAPENLPWLAAGGGGKTVGEFVLGEALLGARMAAVQSQEVAKARAEMGEAFTPGDLGTTMVEGAAFNVGAGAVMRYGVPAAAKGVQAIYDRTVPLDIRMARQLEKAAGAPWQRSAEQQAAINILHDHGALAASNPFGDTYAGIAAHAQRVAEMQAVLDAGESPDATQPAAPIPGFAGAAHPITPGGASGIEAYIAAVGHQESRGDPNAQSQTSSASGKYGFTDGTWLQAYHREFPNSGLSKEAILARKGEADLQERLMRRLTQDNADALGRMGQDADAGNLYVVHHLGEGDARKIFAARPDTPMEALVSDKVMAANPHLRGKSAGEFIAWAHDRMGDAHGEIAARGDGPDAELATIEAERAALAGERQAADSGLADAMPGRADDAAPTESPDTAAQPVKEPTSFDPSAPSAEVQQLLPQLRAIVQDRSISLNRIDQIAEGLGTDAQTVRQGLLALVESGHISQRSDNQNFMRKPPPIERDLTLIEWIAARGGIWDGEGRGGEFKGGDYKSMGLGEWHKGGPFRRKAIRDVKLGPGKHGDDYVLQDAIEAGYFPELEGRASNTYDDLLDPQILRDAINAELSGNPRYSFYARRAGKEEAPHEAAPLGRRSADPIVADGAHVIAKDALDNHGIDLGPEDEAFLDFGARYMMEHSDQSGDWFVKAVNAFADANQMEALAQHGDPMYAEPVHDYFGDPAGPRQENGDPGEDLAGWEPVSADTAARADGAAPSESNQAHQLTPAARDALEAEGQAGPVLPEPALEAFDDPAGDGIVQVADSAWHDVRASVDPNIAALNKQKVDLAAAAPMRAKAEQDGTMGLGLFDNADQPTMFDLGDGKGERSITEIEAELNADQAAIDAIKGCLL